MSVKNFTSFQIFDIEFFVISEDDNIVKIGVNEELPDDHMMIYKTTKHKFFNACYKQLNEYFFKGRKKFDLKFKIEGTEFQKKVWKALLKLPYGKTVSYQYLAQKIKMPKAVRAVGLANKNNPLPILIPCHRVIGKNGKLTGYAGGLELKSKLINLEKNNLKSDSPKG
jgi:methylated-DNA-[protein]-cysteine S-methyltransferase